MLALCAAHNYDPMAELIKEALNPETPQKLRVGIHKELLSYLAPRQKAIELKSTEEKNITIQIVRFDNPSKRLADSPATVLECKTLEVDPTGYIE